MMQDIGIHKVYYSTGTDEKIVCENVKHMVSIQSSTVTRYFYNINNKTDNNESKEIYFESLMKKLFPKEIKNKNLRYFLEHNFKNVLPEYNFNIKKNNCIIFYNKENKQILMATIV
jgi:hypothetical protein